MGRMFGTDGIRGVANHDLTPELVMSIGVAGARVLTQNAHRPSIIIGSDTRLSKDMLFCALTAGICSVGGTVLNAGVIPTPALPYLTRRYGADAAVMISASHNKMQDNGIKWFNSKGYKLPDSVEDAIEALIKDPGDFIRPMGDKVGKVLDLTNAHADYIDFLCSTAQFGSYNIKVALDCANGAACDIAPEVFRRLGASVYVCANEPDGANINCNCGSTHIENLKKLVKECNADVGFAFDGDADRMIAVDSSGMEVNGDLIMGICALMLNRIGKLKNNRMVLTVMSNLGLRKYLETNGIYYEETTVGDRYVLERMLSKNLVLGGEQSGHIIFMDHNTSGDGILSAIQLLNALKFMDKSLCELVKEIEIYPQVLLNVLMPAESIQKAYNCAQFHERCKTVEDELGNSGRLLVRCSGTEPLIRIMLEGLSRDEILKQAKYIAEPLLTTEYGGVIRDIV